MDIVNQTDLVEHIDGEDKLGQPMLHLSAAGGWGAAGVFVLPYFRERTFPGPEGRLRGQPAVDTGRARYESSAEKHHVDVALRYSHAIGNVDFGLCQFRGTGREPTLIPAGGGDTLIPFYEQIDQTGLDVQWVAGEWLLKLEAIYRWVRTGDFFATVGGLEYTFVHLFGTPTDLSLIVEYAYDERGEEAATSYQNDIIFGLRAGLNDAAGSQLLTGLVWDADTGASILAIEASRRLGSNWKLNLEAWGFNNIPGADPLYSLRRDDFLCLELAYYF